MTETALREAARADLEALMVLERACFTGGTAYDEEEYLEVLEAPDAINLVLEKDSGLVAFAGALVDTKKAEGHVVTVNVHPDARGNGLGRRLLAALEARLAAFGVRRVQLEVNVANKRAIRLYELEGYERVTRLPNYYQSYEEPDAFLYEKTLQV